jgi:hypothetical protein
MELPKVPSGAIPYIAVAVGGVLAWRILSGSGSDAAPQIVQTGYDPELVALGTQSALKTKEIESQQAIAMKALDTEVQTTALGNDLARYGIDSEERKYGAGLQMENATLAVQQNLAQQALAQQAVETREYYNLANYQTMVSHDLGKKGIKANFQQGVLGTVTGGLLKLFGA